VQLGPLTFLVGRNGAGKSNFLDALKFLQESTASTLDSALRARGGYEEVLYRPAPANATLALRLELALRYEQSARYHLRLGSGSLGGYTVLEEFCEVVTGPTSEVNPSFYRTANGQLVETNATLLQGVPLQPDRLALVTASSIGPFRAVYDFLAAMSFYHIDPYRMRELQAPSAAAALAPDGSNATSVFYRLRQRAAERTRIVEQYLTAIFPDLQGIRIRTIDRKEAFEFRQRRPPSKGRVELGRLAFAASSMSDGTLRALGVLLALFQLYGDTDHGPSLVGIEEPELALHPFATAALRDAIREATAGSQVIATSHSPDLLNDRDIAADAVRVVSRQDGATIIGPLDAASRRILEEDLYTIGELTRRVELQPASRADVTPAGTAGAVT
jgi:predicted ATPase